MCIRDRFGITGYYDPGQLFMHVAKIPVYPVILCYLIITHQRYRRTDRCHAPSIRATCYQIIMMNDIRRKTVWRMKLLAPVRDIRDIARHWLGGLQPPKLKVSPPIRVCTFCIVRRCIAWNYWYFCMKVHKMHYFTQNTTKIFWVWGTAAHSSDPTHSAPVWRLF